MKKMPIVFLFADGAASGNPGPGGFGALLKSGEHYKEISGGFRRTTNNRMELMAVIEALEAVKTTKYPIEVYSDSKYVIDSIEKGWVFNWVKKTDFGGKKNEDLWRRFLKSYHKFDIKFNWVKGHNGHPENERCDVLATMAADGN
jgi:ribonuclease HI